MKQHNHQLISWLYHWWQFHPDDADGSEKLGQVSCPRWGQLLPPFRPALPVAPDFYHFRATLSNLPASKIATAPSTSSCCMQFFSYGKHESITQRRQNNYPTMVDMFYANLKEGIARLSRGQWWPVIGDQFDETWSSPLHPRLFQTLMQRDRRIKRLIIHWLCWNHQDHLRSSR